MPLLVSDCFPHLPSVSEGRRRAPAQQQPAARQFKATAAQAHVWALLYGMWGKRRFQVVFLTTIVIVLIETGYCRALLRKVSRDHKEKSGAISIL